MTWSPKQVQLAGMAARAAEWSERERQIALKHVGVSERKRVGESPRCSANDRANTNEQFVAFMAIAEGVALGKGRGDLMPCARGKAVAFWRDAATDHGHRMRRLVEQIAGEASERMPSEFPEGFLAGFVLRMTKNDHFAVSQRPGGTDDAAQCDEGQLYRILEGLRAWVGRRFYAAGFTPRTFKIPPSVARGAATGSDGKEAA